MAAKPDDARILQRFFKTGRGEYGDGDRFRGIRVPVLRRLAREVRDVSSSDTITLLSSRWHEDRLLALLLLVERYRRGNAEARQAVFDAYLANTRHINNWDLVDASAPYIVGPHIPPGDLSLLEQLARSDSLWERRIAMLSTLHWIRQGEYASALRLAHLLIDDDHDLIHKAVGWMLREIGKRDRGTESAFLARHYRTMPRTTLRYAIERLPERERQQYLRGTA